jgi:hypothetical protein
MYRHIRSNSNNKKKTIEITILNITKQLIIDGQRINNNFYDLIISKIEKILNKYTLDIKR